MIQRVVERMYSETEENRFPRGHVRQRDKEVLYFKDFNSGAMIENIVARAKKMAHQGVPRHGQKGMRVAHLLTACVDEFSENEDLPNNHQPRRLGPHLRQEGRERIVYIRTLVSGKQGTDAGRSIDTVANNWAVPSDHGQAQVPRSRLARPATAMGPGAGGGSPVPVPGPAGTSACLI